MALQIVSDLHLENPKGYDLFTIIPRAPHLALLGDIGNVIPHKAELLAFFTEQLKNFRTVYFVPGNHEAYASDWPTTIAALREFETSVRADSAIGEFVLLDRTMHRLPDTNITILGCSLFSSIPAESEMAVSIGLNDFFQIDDWNVNKHTLEHERDVEWLNAQVAELEQSDTNIIILTHWSPTTDARSIDPKRRNSPISTAFFTNLSGQPCFKNNKVKIWAFGHTHYNCDFFFERGGDSGRLRLLVNQRGYYFAQAEGFDAEKTVDI